MFYMLLFLSLFLLKVSTFFCWQIATALLQPRYFQKFPIHRAPNIVEVLINHFIFLVRLLAVTSTTAHSATIRRPKAHSFLDHNNFVHSKWIMSDLQNLFSANTSFFRRPLYKFSFRFLFLFTSLILNLADILPSTSRKVLAFATPWKMF